MSAWVEWDNPDKTAIRFTYQGTWTWEELYGTVTEGEALAATVSYKIDHIYDVTESASLPRGAIGQFRNLRTRPQSNQGRMVLVGASSFITTIMQVMFNIYPNLKKNFLVAATLDEARTLLKESIPS